MICSRTGAGTLIVSGERQTLRRLLKLVQIGIRGRVAECAAHRHDLAFVVEGVGKDVMQDERWSADGAVSVRKMKFGVGVQLLVSES